MEKMKMHTPNLTDENILKIKELFPSCVTEARDENGNLNLAVDFDQLKQELSDHIVDGPQERYHLNWPGKREALLTANAPIAKTLRPCREESVDFDATQNLFIEGDNLEALKLLQETYLGKVKMIYIDPPYNTGNDFVYEDDFSHNTIEYLEKTNQVSDDGKKLVANRESNGKIHSKWLSSIYPRLIRAKALLAEEGAIFVSIGPEELANLKKVMDEVFGEGNFIEIFSWVKTSTPPALSTKSRKTNEYILCYEKAKSSIKYNGEPLDGGDQPLLNAGNAKRALFFPKDCVQFTFVEQEEALSEGAGDRAKLLDDILIIDGVANKDFRLEGEFKWTQDFLNQEIKKGTRFVIKSSKLAIRFIRDEEGFKRPTNFIKEKYTSPLVNKVESEVDTNEGASKELSNLMGSEVFSYPKPVSLMKYLVGFLIDDGDIVMDFYAGSGTTSHAVEQWASKIGKNVQYILVQYPEDLKVSLERCNDANTRKIIENGIAFLEKLEAPANISELTKERIRRAGKQILEGECHENWNKDVGFRVLKIDTSNMADVYYRPDEAKQGNLLETVNNIKEGRDNPEDLLFQVLLDWGVDLTLPIEKKSIQGKDVYFVDGDALAACFDEGVTEELVKEIAGHEPLRVVFKDNGFVSDAVKINVDQVFRQLSPSTEVKSI